METYSWFAYCKWPEPVLERVGENLWCIGELVMASWSYVRLPRGGLGGAAHTTACRTSSLLPSTPDLAGFLPLPEAALFFPLCDIVGASRSVRVRDVWETDTWWQREVWLKGGEALQST